MKLKIRLNKNEKDDYVIDSNYIPRYKELLDIGEHRFEVNYVVYQTDLVYNDCITDVILYVTKLY